MLSIDEKYYYLDLNEILDYVFTKETNEGFAEEEIVTDGKDVVQTTATRRNINDSRTNIRYDLVKTMLDSVYNGNFETEESNVKYIQDLDSTSIGNKLIFNTFIEYGFVKNKLD